MKHTFTPERLIANLYHETDSLERIELEVALALNPQLAAQNQRLQNAFRELPKAQFVPRPATIQSILDYSRSATTEPTL